MTARSFLIRGLLAGLFAGLVAFGFAKTIGEPSVDVAIVYEEQSGAHSHEDESAPHEHGDETVAHDRDAEVANEQEPLVSRGAQSTWGLLTATVGVGVALGGIVGLLSGFAVGRMGSLTPGASSATVAVLGFIAFYGVVWFKYPPNPPAVGDDATFDQRTAAYFGMVAVSVVLVVAALVIAQRVGAVTTPFTGAAIGIVLFVVLAIVAGLLMPPAGEVPADFPADALADFRAASLAIQLSLWGTIGLVLGVLADGAHRSSPIASWRRQPRIARSMGQ